MTDGVIQPSSKRRKSNGVSHKEYERLQDIAFGGESVSKSVIEHGDVPYHDPWASESSETKIDPKFHFLDKPKKTRAPKTLKEPPISLIEDASVYPAVPKPKAGVSYNPMFEDYDKGLVEEGLKEVHAERQRLREADIEQQRLDRIAQAQEELDGIQTEEESAWEGIESEYEGEEWLRKRRPERKTPAERNKVKRRKEAERQAKRDVNMKKRAQQAQRIKEIAREVKSKEESQAAKLAKFEASSSEYGSEAALRRRNLGKIR